jgi:formylmethanofuran dehydrogenase subunit E
MNLHEVKEVQPLTSKQRARFRNCADCHQIFYTTDKGRRLLCQVCLDATA